MAESDEEEDYMSDKFLSSLPDSRPGVFKLDRIARQQKKEQKHSEVNKRNKTKPKSVLEEEQRSKALDKALDSENKGFAMLQKMGYKSGMGLGRAGEGRAEPIPLNVKSDRGGLGRERHLKRQAEARERVKSEMLKKRQKLEQTARSDFRQRMREKFSGKRIMSDLYKSQKACEQLDSAKELSKVEEWFWPQVEKAEEEEEEEEEDETEEEEKESEQEIDPPEKLIILTEYLRQTHFYCIWCGTTFTDEADLADNCPGDTSEDHD